MARTSSPLKNGSNPFTVVTRRVYELALISAFLDASQRLASSSKVIFRSSVVPVSFPCLLLELPQPSFRQLGVLRLEASAKLLARSFD
jgi:hypothetical protein